VALKKGLLRVCYEKLFTTETRSSQRDSFPFRVPSPESRVQTRDPKPETRDPKLRALRVSAVQSVSLYHGKPEDPKKGTNRWTRQSIIMFFSA
jgi:hypothetical protein